jgi:hypothetical protein
MTLSFKFANYDNTTRPLELSFADSALVSAVKQQVFDRWPSDCPKPENVRTVVLVAMGRQLEESKSLKESAVMKFDWATPVHVAVKAPAKPPPKSTAVGNPHHQHAQSDSCGCIIM